MWLELDNTFNHNAIVKLEDDLKLKQGHLTELQKENETVDNVGKEQTKALEERD